MQQSDELTTILSMFELVARWVLSSRHKQDFLALQSGLIHFENMLSSFN